MLMSAAARTCLLSPSSFNDLQRFVCSSVDVTDCRRVLRSSSDVPVIAGDFIFREALLVR